MGIQINGQTDTIRATDGTMTLPGTVTYEDVSRVNVTGVSTFAANVHVSDTIAHLGDIDTAIRFPAADTFTVETGGDERVRIDISGNLGIGLTNPSKKLEILHIESRIHQLSYDDSLLTIKGANQNGNPENLRLIGDTLRFNTGVIGSGTERIRIDSSGNFGIGTTLPGSILDVRQQSTGSSAEIRLFNTDQTNATTQEAAVAISPDPRASGARIVAIKENADFSTNPGRDISLSFESVLNGTQVERLRITSNGSTIYYGATAAAAGVTATSRADLSSGGTLDLEIPGTTFVGHLYVTSVLRSNANTRTARTYFVTSRFDNGTQITQLTNQTADGTAGGRAFSITEVSGGSSPNILRFTDLSSSAVTASMHFVGALGY